MTAYVQFPGAMITLKKTPIWNTKATKSSSGKRRATQRYASPLWHFEMQFDFLRRRPAQNEIDDLWATFCLAQGQTNEFFFLDVDDHTASNVPIGTGDGTTTQFQLKRTVHGSSGVFFTDNVAAFSGIPSVFVNGVEQLPTADNGRGLITLASAPAAAATVTWTGTFLYRCAFEDDQLDTQQLFDLIWGLDTLKFDSVRR